MDRISVQRTDKRFLARYEGLLYELGAAIPEAPIARRPLCAGTLPQRFHRECRCLRFFDLPIGVDTLVLRQDEVARRVAADDPFLSRLWSERLRLA